MASVELNIEGLDEFNKKIAELKDIKKVRSKGMTAARKAMKIVELSAKIGAAYIDDPSVQLVGVEAAGKGVDTDRTAATIERGSVGIFHGMKSLFMQNEDGQIDPV